MLVIGRSECKGLPSGAESITGSSASARQRSRWWTSGVTKTSHHPGGRKRQWRGAASTWRVHLNSRLGWAGNTVVLNEKGQRRLYFLRRLQCTELNAAVHVLLVTSGQCAFLCRGLLGNWSQFRLCHNI